MTPRSARRRPDGRPVRPGGQLAVRRRATGPGASRGEIRLGDRRLAHRAGRTGRGARAASRAVAARIARQAGDARRRLRRGPGRRRHARAVRRRGGRQGAGGPMQPSPAASSRSSGGSAGAVVQRVVRDHRLPARQVAPRRHAHRARPAAVAARRADAAGRHRPERVEVAAACLDRSAGAPAARALGRAAHARPPARRSWKGCAAPRSTARPAASANAAWMSWPRPAPPPPPPAAASASSSPAGPPARRRAASCSSPAAWPARTPPTWPRKSWRPPPRRMQ